ncbi:MAG: FHA domain-containing protein, partial [Pyrinomonadaceae bacterium]
MGISLRVTGQDGDADGAWHDFEGPIISVGCDQHAALRLAGPQIAAEQAMVIMVEGGSPLLINRAPGTQLNGEQLARAMQRRLTDEDRIRIGPYLIECRLRESASQSPEHTADNDASGGKPSFEQILNKLRAEDDNFYFLIEGGERLTLEETMTRQLLGWNSCAQLVACDATQLVTP